MHPTQNPYIEYYSLLVEQHKPKQLSDFSTGLAIAQILTKIKQFPVVRLQQNPTTFAHLFSNMKQVYKRIQEFWNKILDKQLDCQEIDLVQLAHHQNSKQIAKILNLLVQTLFLSSERQHFVNKILLTSQKTQHYFMNIVQSTLQKRKTFSPRKQRQQRIYDKMIELDHQNENLQNLITDLCKQKQDIEILYKKSQDKMFAKQIQIKKLNQTLADYTQTPLKNKNNNGFESQDKNAELAQKFKQKMIQLTKSQQKQIINLKQQVQFLSQKAHLINHLQNQVEMYKVKIQANNQAIQQYTDLSRRYAEMKLNLIQKQQMANQYARKLNVKTTKLQQTQQKLVQLQLQLQRKNVMIQQLNHKNKNNFNNFDDHFAGINSLSLHRTLSEHCPEVANSQAQFLYESNKKLRQQLQRSTTTIKQRQSQLQKLKKQYQKRQSFEVQNKKLVTIIQQINEQHDQQKNLIVGCLHQLRMKTLNQLAPRQRAKKHQIKANLRADNIRVLSRGNVRKI